MRFHPRNEAAGRERDHFFYGQDIRKIVETCDEEEMYYVLGSGNISDEDYDKIKTASIFLET